MPADRLLAPACSAGAVASGRRGVVVGAAASAVLIGCGLLCSRAEGAIVDAQNADGSGLDGAGLQDAFRSLGGVPTTDRRVVLELPDVSENGAIVPVVVRSAVPGTRAIAIVVEANPEPVVARFTFPEGTEPVVSTRIKMAQSSRVHAVVVTDDTLYAGSRWTQVTVGGCG